MAEDLSSVVAAIQTLMGDLDATFYGFTNCLKAINLSQTEVSNELRSHGVQRFRLTSSVITLPAGTTSLSKSTTPALPADFLYPEQLWERATGGTSSDWVLMTLTREAIPPSLVQTDSERIYSWFGDALHFPGATGSVDLLIDYGCSLTDFTTPTDVAPVVNTIFPIALGACALLTENDAARADFTARRDRALDKIINTDVRLRQRRPRRPMPFRARPPMTFTP